jgi:hypothetical protein
MSERTPDHVVDVVGIPFEWSGLRGIDYMARRKGDIVDWVTLGHLDAVYRVNIYLKVRP